MMREDQIRQEITPAAETGTPRWTWVAGAALIVALCVAVSMAWNASQRAKSAEQALAAQAHTFEEQVHRLLGRISDAEISNVELQNALASVADRLQATQGEVRSARRQTTDIRDEYAQRLEGVETQLGGKAGAEEIASLGGDVDGVKSDLDATQSSLELTRGEFGMLIARNSEEIEELRRLGERDYYEFTLTGKGTRTRLANLMIELRGTNTKRNQFTVALYVDDMRLEKKNRSVDEPIYFYTRGVRSPFELVINEVGKNTLTGYVSVPKEAATSSAAVAQN